MTQHSITTVHDLPRFLASSPLRLAQDICIDALIDWATLMVDSSGTNVPRYRANAVPGLRPYSPAQQQQWHHYMHMCCACIKKLMHHSAAPHLSSMINMTQDKFARVADVDVRFVPPYYPFEPPIDLTVAEQDSSQAVSHMITALLCSVSPTDAMEVIAAIVVEWLRQLPQTQVDDLRVTLAQRHSRREWSEEDVRCFALEAIAITLQDHPI